MTGKLPRGVLALGFVSLFMDLSSEMVHSLLPLFVTTTLGASALWLGLIEGVGEATASFVKLFSGAISDRMGRRKPLAIAGYGLSALTKPLFALAWVPAAVLFARFADRVGKGIRGAPRDALVADMVPEGQRGAAYGLRQSMDTIGAFGGPLCAMLFMWLFVGDMRRVFALAILPAVVSVAVLALFVREDRTPLRARPEPTRLRLDRASLSALGPPFLRVALFGALLTFARFSEAFLILRASDAGLPLAYAPLALVVMNVVYALPAWPAGRLSDRLGGRDLLGVGAGLLIVSDGFLGFGSGLWPVMAGVAIWGLHMGLTQGLLAAEVAAAAPARLRASAFGAFGFVTGIATLTGNLLAGSFWAWGGSTATFGFGLVCAALCMPCLVLLPKLPVAR